MRALLAPLAVLALCAALGGCAADIPPATAMLDGALTAPPSGWLSYCSRHPEDRGCR